MINNCKYCASIVGNVCDGCKSFPCKSWALGCDKFDFREKQLEIRSNFKYDADYKYCPYCSKELKF